MTKKFDYKGLNKEENKNVLLNNVLNLEAEMRKKYFERLNLFNKDNYESNPEPFRFYKEENVSILILILPIEFNESTSHSIYFLSTPHKRNKEVIVLSYSELKNADSFEYEHQFFDNVLESKGISNDQVIFNFLGLFEISMDLIEKTFIPNDYIQRSSIVSSIFNSIKKDSAIFKKRNETKLSYFAKDVYKFPFSLFDLKPLVSLVDNEDFTYQIDQAMAAYHENLFLPSAATLGVVLETLCIKILESHDIKLKNGDTQLGKLKERLRSEQITTRRDNARLDIAYKVRNLASHSNPGIALKEDCHLMLNVINTIAFDYLEQDK